MKNQLLEASTRWKEEGQTFKNALNDWLDIIYLHNEDPDTDCPEETRKDMARLVLAAIKHYNEQGQYRELRELFPPDSEPVSQFLAEAEIGEAVRKVAYLPDGRILVKIGDYYQKQAVYLIKGNTVQKEDGLIGFGFSPDKHYFSKVSENNILVYQGWDGPLLCELKTPDNLSLLTLQYDSMQLFPDGKQAVLVTRRGIFHLSESTFQVLGREDDAEDDDDTDEDMSADGPPRPASVPADARWNAGENEWESGEYNAQGNPVGEWKWWLAPKGYLCCHTFYKGENGEVMTFTRYHEDGTPSRIGTYVNGEPFGNITWIRSDHPTIEEYPGNAGEKVWKTVSTVRNGYTVEEHYYDKDGHEIQEPFIADMEASEWMKTLAVLDSFYLQKDWKRLLAGTNEAIFKELAENEDDEDEDEDHRDRELDQVKLAYYKAIAVYELKGRVIDDDIRELAEVIDDKLRFMTIWHFLPEYKTAIAASEFSRSILGHDDEEEDDDDNSEHGEGDWQELDLDEKYVEIDYPHAAISPDGKYIVVGWQDSVHIVLKKGENGWEQFDTMSPISEYPNAALFNYKTSEPIVALSSCHFARSGTFAATVKSFGDPDAQFDDDEDGTRIWNLQKYDLYAIDGRRWAWSLLDIPTGFWIGTNDGYIWHRNIETGKLHYLHIGGTPMSMDLSVDGTLMVVGTVNGEVHVLKTSDLYEGNDKNPRVEPYFITNTPFTDEKRYLFLEDEAPLVW